MSKRLMQVAAGLIVVFAAIQLIRPERTNLPVEPGRAIQAQQGIARQLVAVLDRACNNCHSNHSVWPSYAEIAPVSWLVARGVSEGRKAVNFSESTSYSPDRQQALLSLSCKDVKEGRMPMGGYALMYPEAKLSAQDVETVCTASREPVAAVPGAR